jgi:hypothetical protein
MASIAVRCDGDGVDDWACTVTLGEEGRAISTHEVRVRAADVDRLAPGARDPIDLVEDSFAFLLERESHQMILRSFDLREIARYFPSYETDIRRRVRGS